MTQPTTIKRGTAAWHTLSLLADYSAMSHKDLQHLGTHETPEALAALRRLSMISINHDQLLEITPKGRRALVTANKQRWKENMTQPTKAASRTLVNASSRPCYDAAELRAYQGRPGSMVAFTLPSRVGDYRTWRDGRVEVA